MMAKKINFLLGRGERLMEPMSHISGGGPKDHPYTFEQARRRVVKRVNDTIKGLDELPSKAFPKDNAVALFTLHPAYLAKSYYPENLFLYTGLRPIGSRSREVKPESWGKRKKHPDAAITIEFFVSCPRRIFHQIASSMPGWGIEDPGAEDLRKIEDVRVPDNRIRPLRSDEKYPLLEVVLHANAYKESDFILEGFRDYLRDFDVKVDLDRRIHSEGLCFLPVRMDREIIQEVSKFSFLRVAREMPSLRPFRPVLRTAAHSVKSHCALPNAGPLDPTIKVAIFDGGLPPNSTLGRWARHIEDQNIKAPVSAFVEHGASVTSAALFGSLLHGVDAPIPYAYIDHYRVLDEDTGNDPQGNLYDVLKRIAGALQDKAYDFINISVGPDLPIEDDDVHAWTSVLDPLFASGRLLPAVAVGNTGENDWDSGNALIQSPSDCVNAFSIGACDSVDGPWRRTPYSSIGPGRSPGKTKPDVLAFGGCETNPFWVLHPDLPDRLLPAAGTSFAAPSGMRTGIGIRALLGPSISPLAVKALLIHRSEAGLHDMREVGRGRLLSSVEDLITCEDSTAHIVYQGEISAGQWIRAAIPVPAGKLSGRVEIAATLCFYTDTDPQDTINYTRSGLEVVFRPNYTVRRKTEKGDLSATPASKSFFQGTLPYATETELRRDAHKWETVLSARRTVLGSGLNNPVFDIHYNARKSGQPAKGAKAIPYALIVSIKAPAVPNLYDRLLHRYRTQLEIMRPVIEIPIRRQT